NIDGDDSVATPHNGIRIVVIPAPVSTRAHRNHPARLGHLVVNLTQCGGHLVAQGACHNHQVRLAGTGTKDNAKLVKVVSGGTCVHHFDCTASKPKGHGPQRTCLGPVKELVRTGGDETFFENAVN